MWGGDIGEQSDAVGPVTIRLARLGLCLALIWTAGCTGEGERGAPAADPGYSPSEDVATSGSTVENRQRALSYYQAGRHDEALALLRATARQHPEDIDTRYALGLVLYAGLGRLQEAAAELEQAAQLGTRRADVRELLGGVYLGLDRPDKAIEVLLEAVALKPDDWRIHHRLGLAYTRSERLEGAVGAFRDATRRAPYEPQVHLDLARLLKRRGDDAVAQTEKQLFERWSPVAGRVERYKHEIEQDPASLEARYLLGQAYVEQGRPRDALTLFREAVVLDSSYAEAYYGIGAVMHVGGDAQRAIMAYEKAVQLRPDLVLALADLGQAYSQVGRHDRAVIAYRKALELRPDLPLGQSKLGLAYAQAGRLPEAIQAFRLALQQDSSSVDTRNALARACAASGRFDEAIEQWRGVLRLEPDYPRVADFIRRAEAELAQEDAPAADLPRR